MNAVKGRLRLRRGRLFAGVFSVPMPRRIRVLAVGKASVRMFNGALTVLGKRVVSGIVVAPKSETMRGLDSRFIAFRTGHPIPDFDGIRAARRVMEWVAEIEPDGMLLCLISGGASAMLPAPPAGVPLTDKRTVTQRLIRSRASIHEVNTVRRHLSELKGGRLVGKCRAGRIISLIISDVPGNSLSDIGSGLTAPDPTTFQDAIDVLRRFDLWNSAPPTVKNHLGRGSLGRIPDTPKPGDQEFRKVHNVIIADSSTACEAAREVLNRRRVATRILTSSVNAGAGGVGKVLASVAIESQAFGRPIKRSGALVLGGESTVDVRGRGKGGRNQEVALAALEGIAGLKGTAIATLGTDGIDGNSPAAGAVIDGQSMGHAIKLGLLPRRFLARNDSYTFFRRLGDSVFTGPTGTNVGDIYLLIRT